MIRKAQYHSPRYTFTFIPKKLEIIVGIVSTIEILVMRFMIVLTLLEMMLAEASIILVTMSV
jgi:hypothetical protein